MIPQKTNEIMNLKRFVKILCALTETDTFRYDRGFAVTG